MNKNICNNCGRQGHMFFQCKLPISSFGVIIFSKSNGKFKYLMLRRRDSFGYIDFIRGKYSPMNTFQVQNIINEMSNGEIERVKKATFGNMWSDLWTNKFVQHKNEEILSEKKFGLLKNGIIVNDSLITLIDILNESNTNWPETEWEFPKGRRNVNESDLECALREFEEETGISKDEVNLIENLLTFEETFIGSNNKAYKHKYFLGTLKHDITHYDLTNFQESEVSKLDWKTIDECLHFIRPYNLEKKKLITNINNVLEEYSLFI